MSAQDGASFGAGARRLSWVAARVLGWRPEEFWAATPAELAAMLAPDALPATCPLSRAEMTRMMEQDDER